MEDQVQALAVKTWSECANIDTCLIPDSDALQEKFLGISSSERLLIAISGIPGSGKTTVAKSIVARLNKLASESSGHGTTPVATLISLDGYHLTRLQLSNLADPIQAHARRGAAFTFDDKGFLTLVQKLRVPLTGDTVVIYAPSFDHAIKDPVENDVQIPPNARIILFEGNYLSLNKGLWKEAAALMDELWFVQVDFEIARRRLVERHLQSGIAKDHTEADKRATENDLVNGTEIVESRLPVQEIIESIEQRA